MNTILYGIPNCDQVKKARDWLQAHDQPYVFHDFKKAGITASMIERWLQDLPWDVLINRKGTTWRALPDARKAAITDAQQAIALMLEAPSVIKRPVLQTGQDGSASPACQTGFSEAAYRQAFGIHAL